MQWSFVKNEQKVGGYSIRFMRPHVTHVGLYHIVAYIFAKNSIHSSTIKLHFSEQFVYKDKNVEIYFINLCNLNASNFQN